MSEEDSIFSAVVNGIILVFDFLYEYSEYCVDHYMT